MFKPTTILGCFLGLVLLAPQCFAQITSKRLLTDILRQTPAAELVPHGMPMRIAEHVAKQRSDAFVLWGVGESMQPLYAHGTAVVVASHDYEKLKKGMTVVYLNAAGMRVAHCIVGETRGGYLMQGVNNVKPDPTLLTPENFMGVVVEAYASTGTDFRDAALASLNAKQRARVAALTR
jgi:signal peptidase I